MNQIALFCLFAIFTGAIAAPTEKSTYNAACGEQTGVTKVKYDAFNPITDDWTDKAKCYAACELVSMGVMKDGGFDPDFVAGLAVWATDETKPEEQRLFSEIAGQCIGKVDTIDGCDQAYEFTKCVTETSVGVMFLGVLGALLESAH